MSKLMKVGGKPYGLKVVPGKYEPIMVRAVGNCVLTKVEYKTAEFPLSAFNSWFSGGKLIQNTELGKLSTDDREFLINGTTPTFWATVPEDDE